MRQAVIMAGGKGTRLLALTKDEIPKPMAPILGKPLVEWQIEKLKANGIKEVILVIGHLGEKIREYFGDGQKWGVSIRYIEENTPLGTAGSFYYLKDIVEQDFFLIFGDVFFDIDMERMREFHVKNRAKATLFVHPNSHPYDSDLIKLEESGRVIAFDSKHNTRDYWYDNCVNAGFYLLDKAVTELVTEPKKADLEKDILMPLVAAKEAIYGYQSPEFIKDVGTVERIEKTILDIQNGLVEKKNLNRKQSCIFLDRDGTINRWKGLIYQAEQLELEAGAVEAIRLINDSGKLAVVVTNQPAVARGLCQPEQIELIHNKLKTLLGEQGVFLDAIYYCPHHPDKGYPEENPLFKIPCHCRKPDTGMVEAAAARFHIDLASSWMIGDTTVDLEMGRRAGLKTVLVQTGENAGDGKYSKAADHTCADILAAVKYILSSEKE